MARQDLVQDRAGSKIEFLEILGHQGQVRGQDTRGHGLGGLWLIKALQVLPFLLFLL